MKKRVFEVLFNPKDGSFKVKSEPERAAKHYKQPVPIMLWVLAKSIGTIIKTNIKAEYWNNTIDMVYSVMTETVHDEKTGESE